MKKILLFIVCLGLAFAPIAIHAEEIENTEEEITTNLDFGEILQKYITPETIASCVSAVTAIFAVLKLLGLVKKEKNIRIKNADEIANEINKKLEGYEGKIYELVVNKAIQPLTDKVNKIGPTLDLFAKVLALSQNDSPESKLAILELLQKLGNVELIEEQKQEIIKQVEIEEASKQEAIETLEAIEENNIEGRY